MKSCAANSKGHAMKMPTKIALVALLIGSATTPALAATGASTTGHATITILRALSITETNTAAGGLNFGTVVQGSASGSVTVANNSAVTYNNGTYAPASSATPSAGAFQINGEGGQLVAITVPGTAAIGTLTATLTNDIATPASTQLSNALGSAGSFVFHVGGTVPVAAGGPTGTLTGTYSVSVDYN
jgi:hypothetical protein